MGELEPHRGRRRLPPDLRNYQADPISGLITAPVSGNTAASGGGVASQGDVNLRNVTVANNTAAFAGGLDSFETGNFSLVNTIVGDNGTDCAGPVISGGAGVFVPGGHNLIENTSGCTIVGDTAGNITGRDPRLGPLQNNGGTTSTQALLLSSIFFSNGQLVTLPPSPAIDSGDHCETTSQNAVARPQDGNGDGVAVCDIGAYEVVVPTPVGTFALTPTAAAVAPGERIDYTFTWTVPPPLGWRSLDSLELLFMDDSRTALWLRFEEVSGAPGRFALVDPKHGKVGPPFAPGRPNRLETDDATVYLADTSVVGPPGAAVTLHVALGFKPHAAGRTYDVIVRARDDGGTVQGFHRAGSVSVSP
jgi:hypothetical protein